MQDEMTTIQSDPVGVLNDLANTFTILLDRVPATSPVQKLLHTLIELTTLLSSSQLLTRHALDPQENSNDVDVQMHDEKRRRSSLGNGGVLKELVGDLMTLLGGEDSSNEGVQGWLRRLLWRTFEQSE